jgi:HTH-type transcriptional regulator, sugar sensing transcriptional regulator
MPRARQSGARRRSVKAAVPNGELFEALAALGFHLNEARAYVALLRLGSSTGYEVAQRAGVPRSAVYGALRRLVSSGAARAVPGNPERFVATPAESILALLRKRFDASAGRLLEAVSDLDAEPATPDAFSVRGYERVIEEAARIVQSAQRILVLSGWPRELSQLESELHAAERRNVYIVLFSHARLAESLSGVQFSYGLDEMQLESFWRHRLVIVADDRRTLIGATEQREHDAAVLSEAAAVAELAVGQIALDITLLSLRHHYDTSEVMCTILGNRVGNLDSLLADRPTPVLGRKRSIHG